MTDVTRKFIQGFLGVSTGSNLYVISVNKETVGCIYLDEPNIHIQNFKNALAKAIVSKLNLIFDLINTFESEFPQPIRPPSYTNKEIQKLLTYVPTCERYKLTTILKIYQTYVGKTYNIPENKYIEFVEKLFLAIRDFIQSNNLDYFAQCIFICGISGNQVRFNSEHHSQFIRDVLRKHKITTFNQIKESFKVDENLVDRFCGFLDIQLIKLPEIKNFPM